MKLTGLLSAVALCLFGQRASAWWDEGHMLVGAIAREELGAENTAKLEAVLAEFDQYYPGFGRLDTSSVWADHIKCAPDARNPGFVAPYCMGQERLEGLGIFDDLHFVTFIFNPLNVTLKPIDQNMPRPQGNAPWLIEESLKGLKLQDGGSVFSWNIFLRMLIHMVGDIHMPLHTTSLVSNWFGGSSDAGGNKIRVDGLAIRGVDNLHKLWDSVGGAYPNNFPKADLDDLAKEASRLIKAFPRKLFDARVSELNAWNIAKESNKIARKTVYRELQPKLNSDFERDFRQDPYVPSKAYVDEMVPLCQQQITLAGYRLADMLRQTIPFLPPMPKRSHLSLPPAQEAIVVHTPLTHAHGHVSHTVAVSLVVALAVSLVANFMLTRKLSSASAAAVAPVSAGLLQPSVECVGV